MATPTTSPDVSHDNALRGGTIGLFGIVFFVVASAAPMAGLTGVLPGMVALGNGTGAAGAYVAVGIVLLLFAVGYAAMSAHMTNAGAFMAYVGKGLGTKWGVASAYVSVLAYNAVQFCIYGFFGAVVAGTTGMLNWWVWALLAMALIQALAIFRVDVGAAVLGVLLVLELATLVITALAVLLSGDRPEALDFGASFSPGSVFAGAAGVAFAFAFASFIGFEATAIYGEESKDPKRTVPQATYLSIVAIMVVFGLVSFAAISAYGASNAAAASIEVTGELVDPAAFLLGAAETYVGSWLSTLMSYLLISSLFAALLAFHNAAARYFYTMGRAGLLPHKLGTTHPTFRTPVAASVTQTALGAVVIILFALLGLDPVLNLFYWLSGVAVIAINIVQALVCLAVIKFFQDNKVNPSKWQTLIAPALGFIGLVLGEYLLMSKFGLLTLAFKGEDPTASWVMNGTGWFLVLLPFVVLLLGFVVGQTRKGAENEVMVQEMLT
jgi:amino acid transporter